MDEGCWCCMKQSVDGLTPFLLELNNTSRLTAQQTTLSWPQAVLQGVLIENGHDHMCKCMRCVCMKGEDGSVLCSGECAWKHTAYIWAYFRAFVSRIMCVLVCHSICYKASFRALKSLIYQESSRLWLSCSSLQATGGLTQRKVSN